MSSSFNDPVETAKDIVETGGIKEKSKLSSTILLSFLAGAYMAFGVLLSEVTSAGMIASGFPIGLSKFVFGAVYPVGSIIILIAGAELFTGNIMYMGMSLLDGKASWKGLSRNWITSWTFNFAGALFVAYILAYLGGAILADPAIVSQAIDMATYKINLSWSEAFIRGIGCNWMICLGIYLGFASNDIIGKILGVWIPTMTFATIGFEQSIANMFFIPLGMFLNGPGISWSAIFFNNLIPVTLGNIAGGIIFVVCIYYYVYLKNDKSK